MSRQTIKVNGKHYDAVTGDLLTGYVAAEDHAAQANTHKITVATNGPIGTPPAKQTAAVHQPKPSQTLMRTAVKKPSVSKPIHVQHALTVKTAVTPIAVKTSVSSVSHARLERAKSTVRSEHIRRFATDDKPEGFVVQHAHVPVRLAPDKPEEVEEPAGAPQPERTNNPEDMFTRAIATAHHHTDIKANTHAYKQRVRRHFASMAIGTTALVLIAVFAAYLNSPNLQISVAGIQAGVSTKQINFANTGFAYTGVKVERSKRLVGLSTDEARYVLIEEATNWQGAQMIDHISAYNIDGSLNYKKLQFGDQTVYRLNNGNATWVKNGTWYQLNGERAVGDQQLRSLVENS